MHLVNAKNYDCKVSHLTNFAFVSCLFFLPSIDSAEICIMLCSLLALSVVGRVGYSAIVDAPTKYLMSEDFKITFNETVTGDVDGCSKRNYDLD